MRFPIFFCRILAILIVTAFQMVMAADEYKALFKAKKYTEIERRATSQLATNPTDAAALIAKAEAILFSNDEARISQAVELSEQCVAAHPNKSECHLSLGTTLAAKALAAGRVSGMFLAGKIRQAYQQAVALDGKNIEARISLLRYYLVAPAMVGGGIEKSKELAHETLQINPQAGQLMLGAIELREKRAAQVEAAVLSVSAAGNPPLEEALTDMQRKLLIGAGRVYMEAKQYVDAERVFKEVQKRYPDNAWGAFLLARVNQDQGKCAAALPLFEKTIALEADGYAYFLMAQCLELLNEKTRALAAFERALGLKDNLNKDHQKEAAARIKALKT